MSKSITEKPGIKEFKKMTAREFMDIGLLQEINRRFLHPMGLALEVVINDLDNTCVFGEVWDYRDDPEGMIFSDSTINTKETTEKEERVKEMFNEKKEVRENKFGWHIQPVPKKE